MEWGGGILTTQTGIILTQNFFILQRHILVSFVFLQTVRLYLLDVSWGVGLWNPTGFQYIKCLLFYFNLNLFYFNQIYYNLTLIRFTAFHLFYQIISKTPPSSHVNMIDKYKRPSCDYVCKSLKPTWIPAQSHGAIITSITVG